MLTSLSRGSVFRMMLVELCRVCALQVRPSRSPTVRRCTHTSRTPATSPTGVTMPTVACTARKTESHALCRYWLPFAHHQTCTTSSSRRPSATSSTSRARRGYARGSWWGDSLSWWEGGRPTVHLLNYHDARKWNELTSSDLFCLTAVPDATPGGFNTAGMRQPPHTSHITLLFIFCFECFWHFFCFSGWFPPYRTQWNHSRFVQND